METRVKKQHRKNVKKFLLGLLLVIPVAFLVGYEIAQAGYHNDSKPVKPTPSKQSKQHVWDKGESRDSETSEGAPTTRGQQGQNSGNGNARNPTTHAQTRQQTVNQDTGTNNDGETTDPLSGPGAGCAVVNRYQTDPETGKIVDVSTGQEATEAEKNEFMQNQEEQRDYLKRANEKINQMNQPENSNSSDEH
ncbi:hypothetical protein M3M35_07070 [Fructilactobacillus myrtifloralis]|uniref:Uncharacterized protein n=1 Tax=Fructilactobacillus myrtifloralis TaxID=2940301 RepID=A0ABY5BPQ6_9LACO|nr:hypothetical protein [Fructilactobacillus myrtifloralis]USS85043.1 hypothetical protein M3M35_07070 [Fructilactobacillus myrtifloralis]